mmetsp:Transcript_4574/g.11109  ORF Transcript_4574/g.11109 Transcript_4574/m.11109 type:complete len:319 (-) Transcript_4574:130-1086(-)
MALFSHKNENVDTTVHRPEHVFGKVTGSDWDIKREDLKLIKKIGEGATGIIYQAHYCGVKCAAKSLKNWGDGLIEQAYKDIVMELDVLITMGKHPNLVVFHGVCLQDKRNPIVVEELVEGPCLENYLQNGGCRGSLSKPVIYGWIQDMMRALEFLHNRDPVIMHRDLKPGNLIITKDRSSLKLADFGMSKIVRKAEMSNVVNTGYTGTVRYMAPEVLTQRKGHYTEKADIYSAGLIMWYIASGERPPTLSTASEEALRKRPSLESARWPTLSKVIEKLWAHEPDKRPSAAAVLKELAAMPDAPGERVAAPADCGCSVS